MRLSLIPIPNNQKVVINKPSPIIRIADKSKTDEKKSRSSVNEFVPEFCIIESIDAVGNLENLQLEELGLNIQSRRNKIFLLMEEVRRLRIQQQVKQKEMNLENGEISVSKENFKSALPLMPPVTEMTLKNYKVFFVATVTAIILFGGLLAPTLEVRMGLGGQSYRDFIRSIGLPLQLADVDPIVASFCGGAVGVLSALLVVEINNIRSHSTESCCYCSGSGYLFCGRCGGNGKFPPTEKIPNKQKRCQNCSSTGKVMCTSCLCTGKQLATEHDPRLDPWN